MVVLLSMLKRTQAIEADIDTEIGTHFAFRGSNLASYGTYSSCSPFYLNQLRFSVMDQLYTSCRSIFAESYTLLLRTDQGASAYRFVGCEMIVSVLMAQVVKG